MEILVGQDLREPVGDGVRIVCHCCNNIPAMGAGVAKALYMKWPSVRSEYIDMESYDLGEVGFVEVEENIVVANIIGQHNIHPDANGNPPVRYDAIQKGLETVLNYCTAIEVPTGETPSIHIPYLMGCDLAGGKWEEVSEIIEQVFEKNLGFTYPDVYIYDLFKKSIKAT